MKYGFSASHYNGRMPDCQRVWRKKEAVKSIVISSHIPPVICYTIYNLMPEEELPGVTEYVYYIMGMEVGSGIRD